MSGLTLNLDLSYNGEPSFVGMKKESARNSKHQRFIKKRRFLERKGLLRDKQNQCSKTQGPKNLNHGPQPWQNKKKHTFAPSLSHPESLVPRPTPSKSPIPKPTPSKSPVPKPTPSSSLPNPPLFKNSTATASGFFKTGSRSSTHQKYEDSAAGSSPSFTTCVAATNSRASGSARPKGFGAAPPFGNPLKYLALDCEMVGTGPKGQVSELARCSIVSYHGDVVYDKYIMPTHPVTDFRTKWSGICRQHLYNATPFMQAKKEIVKILAGKVVVGHAVHNDFKSLSYSHPAGLTRDTSRIPLLNKKAGFPDNQAVSLKRLAKALLNQDIQVGKKGHSSVEDAKAAMELYKAVEVEWERTLACKSEGR